MARQGRLRLGLILLFVVSYPCFSSFSAGKTIPLPAGLKSALEGADPRPQVDVAADEVAKFISGLPCDDPNLKALQETEEWKSFAEELEKSWAEMQAARLDPMKTWACSELREATAATETLFYPFCGPDFLTAFVLFPEPETYVLLGLEFVGQLPVFDRASPDVLAHVKGYLADLNLALSDFFKKSYFITRNMEHALVGHEVEGVLPLLCFFLKRTDHVISSMKRCEFDGRGGLMEFDFSVKRKITRRPYGVKIEFFEKRENHLRTLYYFSADLEDVVFLKDGSFYRYLNGLTFQSTFIKSASYLMHYRTFSNIKNLILTKSLYVVEDDTGIPYRDFSPKDWDVVLYGEYIKPVSDFKGVDQPDLEKAYAESPDVRKLPFHLGYHWGTNKDSILYFQRKSGPEFVRTVP